MRLLTVVSQLCYDVIARVLPGFFFLVIVVLGSGQFNLGILSAPLDLGHNWMASIGWGLSLAALCYMLGWVFSGFMRKSLEEPTYEQARAKSIDSQLKAGGQVKSPKAMCQWIQSSDPVLGFRLMKLEAEARMLETSRVAMTFAMGVAVVQALILAYVEAESKVHAGAAMRSRGRNWDDHAIVVALMLVAAFILRAGFQRREKRAWEDYWDNIAGSYESLQERVGAQISGEGS